MKKKSLVIFLLLLIVVGGAVGVYMYNKPHKNIEQITPDVFTPVDELYNAFLENEQNAYEQYGGKVIEVHGLLTGIEEGQQGAVSVIVSDGGEARVQCAMQSEYIEKVKSLNTETPITVRGELSGYDDMFGIVKMERCIIVEE